VRSATLAPGGREVVLTLAGTPKGESLGLTVSGVRDRAPAGNAATASSRQAAFAHPVAQLAEERTLDGQGGGYAEQALGPEAPVSPTAAWTINLWLWLDRQPEDYTVIAGFGSCRDQGANQRYLAKFPEGLHFWGSGVDVPARVPLDLGRWQMLTATFDGAVVRLMKDGRELVSQSIGLAEAASIAKLGPPAPWSWGHRLVGKASGFTLWDQALSPGGVAALARLGPGAVIR
jgi:alpha-mannosidase